MCALVFSHEPDDAGRGVTIVAYKNIPEAVRGELAIIYCFVFLHFAAAGGGSWSLDRRLRGGRVH